ncbi:MAG: LytR/AlgR family response regulator transcription factor [Flavobacteriales bacterium]
MRIVIVDDEKKVRQTLVHIISMYYPQAQVVAEADTVQTAVVEIEKHKPQVVLLDINLNDKTGFDVLNQMQPVSFKIIFITAYQEFAVQAFKFSALDYLLKPINPDELVTALDKAQQELKKDEYNTQLQTFITNLGVPARDNKKIILKTQDSLHVVNAADIIRCEADRNYTRFHIHGKKEILVSETLKEYEDMLTPLGFFRAHHSHLVNLAYIERFEKRDGGSLVMKDQSNVPVAVRKKDQLLELLKTL